MAESAGVAFATVVDKVAFVGKIPMLSQATADDEKPTPGYLYQEITNISLQSGAYCQGLLEYLTNRLQNQSYHVKLKTLRIMRHVINDGHPDFRQGLRRNTTGIRHASSFSGPPDPLHGMAPYMMVKKEAQELTKLLFEVLEDDNVIPQPKVSNFQNAGGMGSSSNNRLQGFGNQPVKQKSLGVSIMDSIVEIADKVLDVNPRPITYGQEKRFGDYRPVQVPGESYPSAPSRSMTQSQEFGHVSMAPQSGLLNSFHGERSHLQRKPYVKGIPGGGWADEEEEQILRSSMLAEGDSTTLDQPATSENSQAVKFDPYSSEKDLLAKFTEKCKEKIPSYDDILKFEESYSSLNCDKVVDLIAGKLVEDNTSESQKMGLMLIIESFLRTDIVSFDHIAVSSHKSLITLFLNEQGPVKQKARKIIRILEKISTRGDLFDKVKAPPAISKAPVSSQQSSSDIISALLTDEPSSELKLLNVPFAKESTPHTTASSEGNETMQSTFSFLN